MKFDRKKFKKSNLMPTILVAFLTLLILTVSYIRFTQLAEQQCQQRMQETVDTVMGDVGNKMARDSRMLNAIAELISSEENFDTETMKGIVGTFELLTVSNNIAVLLPGDVIISKTGEEINSSGKISFKKEAALGEHITDRMVSITDSSKMLIRHFVPVNKNGETVAMLYSSTDLVNLPKALSIGNFYNGKADIFIIDRDNGDFIMDTRHEVLGNLSDFGNRKTKGIKTMSDVHNDIVSGKTGHVITKSDTTGEQMYFYYAPVSADEFQFSEDSEIKSWTIAVTVPMKVAYKNLYKVRSVCYILAIAEIAVMAVYLYWIMKNTKETLEKAVLEERLIKAENAEKAKTMFLSNMSHDIRTPMNAIIGYTTLAATNIDNKERIQDYLSKILSSSNHLLSLINDILDMSRIESGRVDIEETECSLPEMLHDLRNILQSQMQAKQLEFYIDTIDVLDEDVYCDKLHLNQVLLNLLSNAVKFTPAGGLVSLIIKQKHGAPEGYASYEIRVKDTGIGMSPEFLKHVFEPFEREQTSTISGIQGTGLGMAIAKNIVDMMGGKIEVRSEQGKGTEYTLSIELRLQSQRKQVEVIKELEGLRALVVDDDYMICDSVTKMLVQLGLRSEWTMSGKEAVLHAKQAVELADEFSAYIIDWQLPDLNGIEVVRRIRSEIGNQVPIIILTAYDWGAIEDEAREAGVTAFCNKPIFVSSLRDTLMSAIGKTSASVEKAILSEPPASIKGKRILLVEDNELNREIAQEILNESGLIIETANDGTAAVDMVEKSKDGYYDLILMDIQMPIMNGYEATKRIRNMSNIALASIPIIAMTANAFNEDVKIALESGMNDHIAKPLDIDRLFEVLQKHLSH